MSDLKIEAGKRYRTRAGRIAKVLTLNGPGDWPAWGHLNEGSEEPHRWNLLGEHLGPGDHDLIAPVLAAEEVVTEALRDQPLYFNGKPTMPSPEGFAHLATIAVRALRASGHLKDDT